MCFFLFFFFVFARGDTSCFPQDERDGISFITITSVSVGKSWTYADRIDKPSVTFAVLNMSGDFD